MPSVARLNSKRIWLECELGADPVWWSPDRPAHLDELPLSDELKCRLRAWASEYDALTSASFDFTEAEDQKMTRQGRELATRVQRELGDRWVVGYLDLERNKVVWPSR